MSAELLVPGVIMLLVGVVLIIIYVASMLFTGQQKSAGLFFTIPGAVLVALGIIAVGTPALFFSWVNGVITSFVALFTCIITIYIYMKAVPPQPPTTTVTSTLVGKEGVVIKDILPDDHTYGKVKIGSTVWSATAKSLIKSGSYVKVVDSEGVHVIVEETKAQTGGKEAE